MQEEHRLLLHKRHRAAPGVRSALLPTLELTATVGHSDPSGSASWSASTTSPLPGASSLLATTASATSLMPLASFVSLPAAEQFEPDRYAADAATGCDERLRNPSALRHLNPAAWLPARVALRTFMQKYPVTSSLSCPICSCLWPHGPNISLLRP